MMRTSSPIRTRRLRCQRCSEKKFRTRQDLALHVLSKHAKLELPTVPADDTRSITLSSPMLSGETEEIDQLLANALRNNLVRDPVNGFKPHVEEHLVTPLKAKQSSSKRPRKQAVLENQTKRAKSVLTETTTTESCQSPHLPAAQSWAPHPITETERNPSSRLDNVYTPVPGESIGPCAQDVFHAQCRTGHISLIPTLLKQTTTLNFANALF